jgi:REP element-mobilizing transposase RayT
LPNPVAPQLLLDFKQSGASLRGQPRTTVPTYNLVPRAFYRRQLPHLQCDYKQHFVTFCTDRRWALPERVRSTVLECCLHHNGERFDLRVAVVMPNHVHMIFTPLVNQRAMEIYSLAEIMDSVKGFSAHRVNKKLGRKGRVWQPESFDHVVRSSESLDAKIAYLLENPVRAGMVGEWARYPWLWKKPFVNPFAGALEP